MRINDPQAVAAQYATEANLEARRSLYAKTDGPDPRQVALDAVGEVRHADVLEVGGGPGELAARIQDELVARVVMVDISERMVELARGRGVDARVGTVEELPFPDESFDCAVAAWMLFHVPDIDRGLGELARVLRPGGRLVAVTNAADHLRELRELAGTAAWARVFTRENGAFALARHFRRVERRDADGWIEITDAETVHGYVASLGGESVDVQPFSLPFRSRRASSVFVAEKA